MGVFFVFFVSFMVLSIILSEKDRKRRAAARRMQIPPIQNDIQDADIKVPEPATTPQKDSYYGEDVPRTTTAEFHEESKPAKKELDLDPEKMIIYSEILKPKF